MSINPKIEDMNKEISIFHGENESSISIKIFLLTSSPKKKRFSLCIRSKSGLFGRINPKIELELWFY